MSFPSSSHPYLFVMTSAISWSLSNDVFKYIVSDMTTSRSTISATKSRNIDKKSTETAVFTFDEILCVSGSISGCGMTTECSKCSFKYNCHCLFLNLLPRKLKVLLPRSIISRMVRMSSYVPC